MQYDWSTPVEKIRSHVLISGAQAASPKELAEALQGREGAQHPELTLETLRAFLNEASEEEIFELISSGTTTLKVLTELATALLYTAHPTRRYLAYLAEFTS